MVRKFGKYLFNHSFLFWFILVTLNFLLIFTHFSSASVQVSEKNKIPFNFGTRQIGSEFNKMASEIGTEWHTLNIDWHSLEPTKGQYNWKTLDQNISGLHNLGIEPYVILQCYSEWGTPSIWEGLLRDGRNWNTALPEGEENLEAWKDFVKNLIERYDGDGINDMPGLLKPVSYFQVSEEWPSAWNWTYTNEEEFINNVSNYVELLKITSESAKQVNSDSKIIVAGLTTGYRFLVYADGYITDPDGGLRKGLNYTPTELKEMLVYKISNLSIRYIIEHGNLYFDIFSIHAFEEKDTFLEGKIRWLEDTLAEYGCSDKKIMLSAGHGPFSNTKQEIACMDENGNVINDPYPTGCPEVNHYDGDFSFEPWTQERQSQFVVKIYTIAQANDVAGPPWNLGSTELIPDPFSKWNGPFTHSALTNGIVGRKPGFYTYKMMISKIKGSSYAEELHIGGESKVVKFTVNNKPIIVAWNNNGAKIDLSPYLSSPNAQVTHIVTKIDENNHPIYPPDAIVPATSIQIDETPIFIEETIPHNQPPIADAGPDQTVDEGQIVTLNGSNSTDADDGIASYNWVQISGPQTTLSNPNAQQATITAPNVGKGGASLTFKLIVVDHSGVENTDTCVVNVTWLNEPPEADAGIDQTVDERSVVTLDGTASLDIDDGIAAYSWVQISGPSVTLSDHASSQTTFTAPNVGPEGASLTFGLTVTDMGDLQNTDSSIVNVSWQNEPPIAVVAEKYIEVNPGATVSLDGSESTDVDDGIASYLWTQVDGTPATLSDPSSAVTRFIASETDRYGRNLTFELLVTDFGGLKGTANCMVYITPEIPEIQKDNVAITSVTYISKWKKLSIEAVSDAPEGSVTLTVYANYGTDTINLGELKYSPRNKVYRKIFRRINSVPDAVTVTSTGGGTDTK